MKILFCIPEPYNGNRWGGVTTYTILIASQMVQMGHDVTIVTPGEFRQTRILNRVQIYNEPWFKTSNIIFRIFRRIFPAVMHRVGWMVAVYSFWVTHGPYDIVEYPEWGSSGLLIRLFTKQKCVCRIHRSAVQYCQDNAIPVSLEDRIVNAFEIMSILTAHASSSPTQYMYDSHRLTTLLLCVLSKPSKVIPCGVRIPDEDGSGRTGYKYPYILYVGRIEEGKGCETLVRAFVRLHSRLPALRLMLIGEDTEMVYEGIYRSFAEYLRQEALDGENQKFVNFVKRKTQKQLIPYYRNCLVVAVPSKGNENMPFGALDAIRFGKPLIVTNTGGLPEFVIHLRNGLVVPAGDEIALSNAILRIARDAGFRRRFAANNCADRKKFDCKVIAPLLLRFYEMI